METPMPKADASLQNIIQSLKRAMVDAANNATISPVFHYFVSRADYPPYVASVPGSDIGR